MGQLILVSVGHRWVNLEIAVEILKAFPRRGGHANLYQLYNVEKIPSSKKTLLKYIRIFCDRGLLEESSGKTVGALKERIYSITLEGENALKSGEAFLKFFKAHGKLKHV